MERKAQLSEQEGNILKKYQILHSISLVPKFEEKEIIKFFLMFEKRGKEYVFAYRHVLFVLAKCVNLKGQRCVVCSVNSV